MSGDVLLRPAHPGDVAAIRTVAERAWHDAYDDILGAAVVDDVLEEWYDPEAVEAGIENEAQDFVVAVRDETVIGYAHAGPHPPHRTFHLYRLYVDPAAYREGIGTSLLAEIEQHLYDRDVDSYDAEVVTANERAVAFYEATGFERVEEFEGEIHESAVDQYRFRKRL